MWLASTYNLTDLRKLGGQDARRESTRCGIDTEGAIKNDDDPNILVISSQSVLATFDDHEVPDTATASMEVDLGLPRRPHRGQG